MDNHNEFAHLYPDMIVPIVPNEIIELMKDDGFKHKYLNLLSYLEIETIDEDRNIDEMIIDAFDSFEYVDFAYTKKLDRFSVKSPYLNQICNSLDIQFKQLDKTNYHDNINLKKNTILNPYKYKLPDTFKIHKYNFLILKKFMHSKKYSSFEQFKKKAEKMLCSEWSKMNEHGEYFVDFYKYPENTEEYKNAYTLTRSRNIQFLFDLPYSKHFILKVAKFLCRYGPENVEMVYNLCEWIKQMNDYILSLK